MGKKSIIEEAILEAKEIEEALKENAKEILTSSMKGDIEEIVKESLVTEAEDDYDDDTDSFSGNTNSPAETLDEVPEVGEVDDEVGDMNDVSGEENLDSDVESGAEMAGEPEVDASVGDDEFDLDSELGNDMMDLTGSSDDEVIKVFKKLSADDEVLVQQNGDDSVTLKDGENEYRIEMNKDAGAGSMDDDDDMMPIATESRKNRNEVLYEIELDEMEFDEDDEETVSEDEVMGDGAGNGPDTPSELAFEKKLGKIIPFKGKKQKSPVSGNVVPEGKKYFNDNDDDMTFEGKKIINMNDDDIELEELGEEELAEMTSTPSSEGFDEKKGPVVPFKGKKQKSPVSGNVVPEGTVEESPRVHTQGMGHIMKTKGNNFPSQRGTVGTKSSGVTEGEVKRAMAKLMNENKKYRNAVIQYKNLNTEYKKALTHFRSKLNEVAVFNTNLAYATRVFTEHSTTKDEKLNILKRFDEVSDIKKSKSLYKQIVSELTSKGSIVENVQTKLNKTINSGATEGKSTIVESTVYKDSQFLRSLDIMNKINNK